MPGHKRVGRVNACESGGWVGVAWECGSETGNFREMIVLKIKNKSISSI